MAAKLNVFDGASIRVSAVSSPLAETFATLVAVVGSTMLTLVPVAFTAAYETPPAASSSAMHATTSAGLGRRIFLSFREQACRAKLRALVRTTQPRQSSAPAPRH